MQRVALVGAGGMGAAHAAAYENMLNAELVAVVDVQRESADKLATSFDVPAYTDFDLMLIETDPDVVDICTPTLFHKENVLKAAEAKKHVVLEKPMARTLADCREMIDATNRAGVTFMVAQVLRFFADFAMARERILGGAVGTPAIVRSTRGRGFPGSWFGNYEASGGVVMDTLVHDFDWLLWTFGEAERVYAKGLGPRMEELQLDYALVTIRFKSGVIAHVEGNWAHTISGFTVKLEVAGDRGLLDFYNKNAMPLQIKLVGDGEGAREAIPENPSLQDPYFLELQHFIDSVEGGAKPSITPEESMRAVEIGLAALESVRTGTPVSLPMEL